MMFGDLVPWKRRKTDIDIRREDDYPFTGLARQMNRLFDDILHPFDSSPFAGLARSADQFVPRLNVTENDKHIKITAELPGMDEKDIELTLGKDSLTIKGEKQQETEEKDKNYYRRECSFGSFQRTIPLPAEIDDNQAEAKFEKGVLKITLPKTAEAQKRRKKIEVKSG